MFAGLLILWARDLRRRGIGSKETVMQLSLHSNRPLLLMAALSWGCNIPIQGTCPWDQSACPADGNTTPDTTPPSDNTGGTTSDPTTGGTTSDPTTGSNGSDPGTTTCTSATYEAESMYHSTGGSMSGGWNIYSNGYISTDATFAGGSTTVTVVASGSPLGGQWPHMVVSIDGASIGDTTVGTSDWAAYEFTATATAGTHEIRVAFDNDAYSGGEDRNLHVDSVVVGCSGGSSSNTGSSNNGGSCVPETDGQFCARLGKTCGSASGADNCGQNRTAVTCGPACSTGSDPTNPLDSYPTDPMSFQADTVMQVQVNGNTDWIFVPSTYDRTHNTPMMLFVWLHGCGGTSSWDIHEVSPGGSQQDWISLTIGGAEGGCWNASRDTPKVLEAIADIKTHFNIKPKATLLGGYSSGGDLTYYVAFHNAELFAGVLTENSSPMWDNTIDDAKNASWKFHIAHLAHTNDDTFTLSATQADFAALQNEAGFPDVNLYVEPGTHWDDRTWADYRQDIMPYLHAGWSAP